MPYCQTCDVRLYYEIQGRGPELLFISGLNGGTWSWFAQVPFLQKFYRTITLDNRGAGRSDLPPGPYRMSDFAADALCLLDHLKIDQALVIGVSMGGMIAQELALRAPARFTALVLACTHCGAPERIPPAPGVIDALAANQGLSQAEIVEKDLPYHVSREFLEGQPEILAAYRAAQLSAPPQPYHAFLAQLAAIQAFSCCRRLPELTLPTLVVTGAEDIIVPPANARLLAGLLPRAELAEIPGAGHAVHVERTDEFNTLVHRFLQKHGKTYYSGQKISEAVPG
jgi:pimeloyl-ACP methyl ester carboxylesterase